MARRLGWSLLLTLCALALLPAAGANAAEPPWCGTPTADYSVDGLPEDTDDPVGNFPHIPYYAIGCTLEDIAERSDGRMKVRTIGDSALGRDLYSVVINELDTRHQQRDYLNWLQVRKMALKDPARAQRMLERFGANVKVPIFVQGGIHGDEFEGVDAALDVIERFATTRYGRDDAVDRVLDHAVLIFNPIQNPDGRIAGTRSNGNGFDLNRDYLTQSQSETKASITLMKKWLPPEVLDLHGYVSPTLIEATTKPHNPSIEYDLWLKWNQPRIDANEAAVNAIGRQVGRPINDWCSNASPPEEGSALCPDGRPPGPQSAEGWDDWGPFYTPMYAQHLGLDSSTVEMCEPYLDEDTGRPTDPECGGRAGARDVQIAVVESTFPFVVDNRVGMLEDELEMYRRGDVDAPRPECCPAPFDVDNNWMHDYPQAYVVPVGDGQRSDAEANRLVEWMLFNDIEVHKLKRDTRVDGQTFEKGSYVVWMTQPRRGLADTALSIGVDITPRIGRLYAPPAAWSHGYLWGADTVTIADDTRFRARTNRIKRPTRLKGSVPKGNVDAYTLEVDSPTAVRALNALVADGAEAALALEAFNGGPAGTAVIDGGDRSAVQGAAGEFGLDFGQARDQALPDLDPIERVPRIAVLAGAVNQDVWSLRQLGFAADPVSTTTLNTSPTDPLANYDVVFSAAGFPNAANPQARTRLQAFFAGGGGYIGVGTNGANFLVTGGQVTGLTPANRSGFGRSGIVVWDNVGGEDSIITGAYPEQDTAIVDPPTWFTALPATLSADGRLPTENFFAAGLWPIAGDAQSASAFGAPIIAHGANTAGTARLTVFANNPLYRADPEREWPMVGSAAYWGAN